MSILIQVTEESNRQGSNNPPISKLYGIPFISLVRDNGVSATIILDGKRNNEERIVSEDYATISSLIDVGYIDSIINLNQTNGDLLGVKTSSIVEVQEDESGNSIITYRDSEKQVDIQYTVSEDMATILSLIPVAGGGSSSFDWNRQITGLPSIGQTPGGTTTNEGLEAIFYPFVPATLSLNSFSDQEEGTQVTPTLIGTLTPNQETIINTRIVQVGGIDTDTFATNNINQPAPSAITANTTYRLKSNVDNNGSPIDIFSPNREVEFVFPWFYGTSLEALRADVLTNTNFYTDGTKVINDGSGQITVPFSGTGFLWFAVHNSIAVKTAWFETVLNNGAIGTPSDLFDAPVIQLVNSTGLFNDYSENYNIYVTNFQTTGATLLIS